MTRKGQDRGKFRQEPMSQPHHMAQYPYNQPEPPDAKFPPFPERFDHPPAGFQPSHNYPPPQFIPHQPPQLKHPPVHYFPQQQGPPMHPSSMGPPMGHHSEKVDHPSSVFRVAIFILNPKQNYQLVEEDLRELFSCYSDNIQNITIWHDRTAAEVVLSSLSACTSACRDLDGLFLQGVGTLNCVVLNPGQTIESSIPFPDNGMRPAIELKRICRLELIDIFTFEPEFNVTNNILGQNNCNVEYIMSQTANKVEFSLRGKPLDNAPVADRLHISLSSTDAIAYQKAVELTEGLLKTIIDKFYAFCSSISKPPSPSTGFRRHEYQERPDGSLEYLGAREMDRQPQPWRK